MLFLQRRKRRPRGLVRPRPSPPSHFSTLGEKTLVEKQSARLHSRKRPKYQNVPPTPNSSQPRVWGAVVDLANLRKKAHFDTAHLLRLSRRWGARRTAMAACYTPRTSSSPGRRGTSSSVGPAGPPGRFGRRLGPATGPGGSVRVCCVKLADTGAYRGSSKYSGSKNKSVHIHPFQTATNQQDLLAVKNTECRFGKLWARTKGEARAGGRAKGGWSGVAERRRAFSVTQRDNNRTHTGSNVVRTPETVPYRQNSTKTTGPGGGAWPLQLLPRAQASCCFGLRLQRSPARFGRATLSWAPSSSPRPARPCPPRGRKVPRLSPSAGIRTDRRPGPSRLTRSSARRLPGRRRRRRRRRFQQALSCPSRGPFLGYGGRAVGREKRWRSWRFFPGCTIFQVIGLENSAIFFVLPVRSTLPFTDHRGV